MQSPTILFKLQHRLTKSYGSLYHKTVVNIHKTSVRATQGIHGIFSTIYAKIQKRVL
jgi:hypothetical protein